MLFGCGLSSVTVGASFPDACSDAQPPCLSYPITNTSVFWFSDSYEVPTRFNTPDPGYALDINVTAHDGTVYDFSIRADRGTGTDYSEMQAFHNRHKNNTNRRYVDGTIYRGIGNANLPGVGMNYESFGNDGSYHTGAAAIQNVCGVQYTFEIWADGPGGNYGENFGALIAGMDYGAC